MLATLAALAIALAPVQVTLSGLSHTPRVKVKNYYTVRATSGGRPAAGRLTEVMIDPLGGKHPVTYGPTPKPLTNWPFKGVFRDFLIFPASGRGVSLTFRVTVVVGKTKRTIDFKVTPRA